MCLEGFVDLAKMAKDLNLVQSAQCSLSAISDVVLKMKIDKGLRTSNWESPELSPELEAYAIIDVLAAERMYLSMLAWPRSERLNVSVPAGTIVDILTDSGRPAIIGKGTVCERVSVFEGEKMTPTKELVRIDSVCSPGAIIGLHPKVIGELPISSMVLVYRK